VGDNTSRFIDKAPFCLNVPLFSNFFTKIFKNKITLLRKLKPSV
jgi:hypothetical protein